MPKKIIAVILTLSLFFALGTVLGATTVRGSLIAPTVVTPQELPFETLVAKAQKSVVVVYADDGKTLSQATGFFYGKPGQIVTCYHVIDTGIGKNINVKTQDGKLHDAKLVAYDQYKDWAVLQIEDTGYPILEGLPDAYNVVTKGTKAFIIGHPFGQENVVTIGIISNKYNTGYVPYNPNYSYILNINAYIEAHEGNSGSPFFDYQGRVIGVVRTSAGLLWGKTYLTVIIPIDVIDQALTPKPVQ